MQASLFAEIETLKLPGAGELKIWRSWLPPEEASCIFAKLNQQVIWQQPSITIAGQARKIPRQQAWYGEADTAFSYSGQRFNPLPFTADLRVIKAAIEQTTDADFNSALVNRYRDQRDSVAMHADDEPEFGVDPQIASLSLGASRVFSLKPKPHFFEKAAWHKGKAALKVELHEGDLLLMGKGVQAHWLHAIPKVAKLVGPRINITFRQVLKPASQG